MPARDEGMSSNKLSKLIGCVVWWIVGWWNRRFVFLCRCFFAGLTCDRQPTYSSDVPFVRAAGSPHSDDTYTSVVPGMNFDNSTEWPFGRGNTIVLHQNQFADIEVRLFSVPFRPLLQQRQIIVFPMFPEKLPHLLNGLSLTQPVRIDFDDGQLGNNQ